MIQFVYMENWDLQAVVGGSCSSNDDAFFTDLENPPLSFGPWSSFQLQEDDVMNFPEIFGTNNPKVVDELEELYKPFLYPADDHQFNPYSSQTIITSSLPVPHDVNKDSAIDKNQKGQQSATFHQSGVNNDSAAKPKRSSRKNQQNRVVKQVTADDLPSDIWAWRKYGQKPIKGSPYPRSYYRCSSSKGCLARKQVERSCSDPKIFIITYTAEHSHGHPTRRNSLAGSTRTKSSSSRSVVPKSRLANKNEVLLHEVGAETVLLSPTSTIKDVDDHDVPQDQCIKMEELHLQMLEEDIMIGDDQSQGDKIHTPDIMLSDELVQSLDNFESLSFLDQFPELSLELWSMNGHQ